MQITPYKIATLSIGKKLDYATTLQKYMIENRRMSADEINNASANYCREYQIPCLDRKVEYLFTEALKTITLEEIDELVKDACQM